MSVALNTVAHNVLESLHKSAVTGAPLSLTSAWIEVLYHESNTSISLNLLELLGKPRKMVTRIGSVSKDPPVKHVADLGIDPNYAGSARHLFAVSQSNRH